MLHYSGVVDDADSRALMPVGEAALRGRRTSPAAALVRAARSPLLRRAAAAGVAFGLGLQLSRALHAGRLWRLGSTARDAYRVATGRESPSSAWRKGGWARRSLTVVAVVYRVAEGGDRT